MVNCCLIFRTSAKLFSKLAAHSTFPCWRVSVSLHHHQHQLSPVFLITAILVAVKSYLIVILICMSLITSDWRRQWHPTLVLLPGKSRGRRSLQAAVHGVDESRTRLSDFTFMHWRRKWQPTPVFLPGESQGRGSLVGCRLWGHTESDTTEVT